VRDCAKKFGIAPDEMDTRRLLGLMLVRIGRPMLATALGVPLAILDDWIAGHTPMPDEKLGALIDLIDETSED
jgi:hypothetical protein